jgi:hypothetical protein
MKSTQLKTLIKSDILINNIIKNKVVMPEHALNYFKQLFKQINHVVRRNKSTKIVFLVNSEKQKKFINIILEKHRLDEFFIVISDSEKIKTLSGPKIIISLNENFSKHIEHKLKDSIDRKIYTFFILNYLRAYQDFGTYNYVGEIDNLKKLVFVVLFVIKIFNRKLVQRMRFYIAQKVIKNFYKNAPKKKIQNIHKNKKFNFLSSKITKFKTNKMESFKKNNSKGIKKKTRSP